MHCMVLYLKINTCKHIFIPLRLLLKISRLYHYPSKCRLTVNENKIVCEIKKEDTYVFHSWARGKFSQQDDSVMINLLTAVMLIRISLS